MVDVRVSGDDEIQLKGEMVMKGYYKNEEATKDSFTPDGWFKTQDVGHIEGDEYKYVVITDRIKDLIVTSGAKIFRPSRLRRSSAMKCLLNRLSSLARANSLSARLSFRLSDT